MLRGASAEAMADLRDQLGSPSPLADAAIIGDELFSVSSLLRSDAALRRVATDASLPAEGRQGLARQIFEGKVGAATLAIVESAFGHRWTSQRDLPDVLERLSEVAIAKSTGAKADRLADELFGIGQLLTTNPELRDALANPGRSIEDRIGLVDTVLGDKVLPATVTLTKQALAGTYGTLSAALEVYRAVVSNTAGEGVATVRVARPLSDDERTRLQQALSRQYGREIHVNEVVDPDVIGGIRVEIGDDVIDGTVVGRLDDARRRLAS
ncbi:F0F1 ATP synthase subunit delta [Nocardioides sp.]|uniref:F0F1 ATP synthase subunit delta n=1 Tax=Nocardioides sp. TaxID=35761 RepID=UPI002ED66FEF